MTPSGDRRAVLLPQQTAASLPDHVVLAVLALVDSAGVVEADRLHHRS
jgi:hypothetical protein